MISRGRQTRGRSSFFQLRRRLRGRTRTHLFFRNLECSNRLKIGSQLSRLRRRCRISLVVIALGQCDSPGDLQVLVEAAVTDCFGEVHFVDVGVDGESPTVAFCPLTPRTVMPIDDATAADLGPLSGLWIWWGDDLKNDLAVRETNRTSY